MTTQSLVTVLVVEDEAFLLFAIADDLREAGFDVLEASNADQAIRILESRQDIAILFTDIDMPGSMDGLRLSAAVRDRWPPVKIIVASGRVRLKPSDLPPGSAFLEKPYHGRTMIAQLRAMVDPTPALIGPDFGSQSPAVSYFAQTRRGQAL